MAIEWAGRVTEHGGAYSEARVGAMFLVVHEWGGRPEWSASAGSWCLARGLERSLAGAREAAEDTARKWARKQAEACGVLDARVDALAAHVRDRWDIPAHVPTPVALAWVIGELEGLDRDDCTRDAARERPADEWSMLPRMLRDALRWAETARKMDGEG